MFIYKLMKSNNPRTWVNKTHSQTHTHTHTHTQVNANSMKQAVGTPDPQKL